MSQFPNNPYQQPTNTGAGQPVYAPMPDWKPPQQGKPWTKYLLFGCLGAFTLTVLVCGGLGFYVAANAKKFGVQIVRTATVAAINSSQIPADQKKGMITQIDRVAADFQAGKITQEQFDQIMQGLGESRIFEMGRVLYIEHHQLANSSLSEQEKSQGSRSLQRVMRGLKQAKIDESTFSDIVSPLMQTDPKTREETLVDKPTPEAMRETLARATKAADAAAVPDEAFKVDLGEELKTIVDQALAKP